MSNPSVYKYRLKSTGSSSSKFGLCEVCGEHASDVFIQAEMAYCVETDDWTYHDCRPHSFGHEICLQGLQR